MIRVQKATSAGNASIAVITGATAISSLLAAFIISSGSRRKVVLVLHFKMCLNFHTASPSFLFTQILLI